MGTKPIFPLEPQLKVSPHQAANGGIQHDRVPVVASFEPGLPMFGFEVALGIVLHLLNQQEQLGGIFTTSDQPVLQSQVAGDRSLSGRKHYGNFYADHRPFRHSVECRTRYGSVRHRHVNVRNSVQSTGSGMSHELMEQRRNRPEDTRGADQGWPEPKAKGEKTRLGIWSGLTVMGQSPTAHADIGELQSTKVYEFEAVSISSSVTNDCTRLNGQGALGKRYPQTDRLAR